MASLTASSGPSRSPSGSSNLSAKRQATYQQIQRTLARLQSNPDKLLQQDPDLLLPSLAKLEYKINTLRNGQECSSRELEKLSVATQSLIRQVTTRRVRASHSSRALRGRSFVLTTPAPSDQLLPPLQSLRTHIQVNATSFPLGSPFASSSAMGRFLEEALAPASSSIITLPPAPKLDVGSIDTKGDDDEIVSEQHAKRQQQQEEEDEGLAEYEAATHLRQRRGGQRSSDSSSATTYPPKPHPPKDQDDDDDPKSKFSTSPHLTSDRSTQEALSTELLRMASLLKSQSISFSSSLERDRQILEGADEQLMKNLNLMTKTRGRLGEYAHKARGMGWLTLGTIVVVIGTWVVMFVVIKLT